MRPVVQLLALLVLAISADALGDAFFETQDLAYGPNLEASAQGVGSIVQGAWIPLANTNIGLTWIESLRDTKLGTPIGSDSRFIRFNATGTVSPWYTMMQAVLGFRVLPRFEFAAVYQVSAYLNSNVRQALPSDSGGPSLRETWSENYFFSHLYKNSPNGDLLQVFGGLWGLDLTNRFFRGGAEYHFYLVDVNSSTKGKSLDYERMLPVDQRDFFFEVLYWSRFNLTQHCDWSVDLLYQQTGLQTKYFGEYAKESVQQVFAFTGPAWTLADGRFSLLTEAGYLWRPEKYETGSWAQHVLFKVLWKGHWNLG